MSLNFEQQVIQRSQDIPVVVDFWAPWCGPCRVLGPVIEQLAAEQAGRWELIKLNTEEEPELAQQYQIRGIPNVKLFYKGKVKAEFAGALPKRSIEQWLDEHIPDTRKKVLDELLAAIEADPSPAKVKELGEFVAQHPDYTEAAFELAKWLVYSEPEKAVALLQPIRMGGKWFDQAEDLRVLATFMQADFDPSSKVGEAMGKAQEAVRQGALETGIQQVIEAIQCDKSFMGDLPRKLGIAFFRIWGAQDPLTKNYRWRFDMALY
jgi:putative thioredoxin